MDSCNLNKKYILNSKQFCNFFDRTQITNIQNTTINNNNILLDLVGFETRIEPAGCSGEVLTQENHVLATTGGSVSPKNIVVQTVGSNSIYGSFSRDDTLTDPKGDVRGSGANDLSVSRELCSQVASGELSAILGGRNNTASGDLSVVVGGSNNISSGSNSTIVGGTQNINDGISSVIITGVSNEVLTGETGFNVIGAGRNNLISGDHNSILSGTQNIIQNSSSTSQYNVIITGQSNVIQDSSYSWIGTGLRNNITSGSFNVINGGQSNLNSGLEFNCIGAGQGNRILNGSYNTIAAGCNCVIAGVNTNFSGIFIGIRNSIVQDASYCCIIAGTDNGITGGIANSIVAGRQNNILLGNQGFNFIGSGVNNALNGGFNAIVAGSNNRIDSSSSIYNAIVAGQNNTLFGSISNSFVGAGSNNRVNGGNNSAVVVGISGEVTGNNSVIVGGSDNLITIDNSFICGEGLRLTQFNYPSAAFGRFNLEGITGATGGSTGSNRIFMVGNGSAGNRTNAFSVTQDGVCIAQLAFATGGADFAEYFESHSKYTSKLPCCESVILIDDRFIGKTIDPITKQFVDSENGFTPSDIGKIMISSDVPEDIDIEVFGVIVQNSGYIGNSYDEEWQGKYERDELNNFIYQDEVQEYEEEEYTYTTKEIEESVLKRIEDENGNISYIEKINKRTIEIKNPILEEYPLYNEDGEFVEYIKKPKITKKTRVIRNRKLSSNYDTNLIYIPRTDRPEWNLVALLGQVMIKEGQRVKSTWSKMNKINDTIHKYFIK
jgi:hypothetical protein